MFYLTYSVNKFLPCEQFDFFFFFLEMKYIWLTAQLGNLLYKGYLEE